MAWVDCSGMLKRAYWKIVFPNPLIHHKSLFFCGMLLWFQDFQTYEKRENKKWDVRQPMVNDVRQPMVNETYGAKRDECHSTKKKGTSVFQETRKVIQRRDAFQQNPLALIFLYLSASSVRNAKDGRDHDYTVLVLMKCHFVRRGRRIQKQSAVVACHDEYHSGTRQMERVANVRWVARNLFQL